MASVSALFVFFLLSYLVLLLSAQPEETYSSHNCPPFPCGDLGWIGFPFASITHPNCGIGIVDCSKNPVMIQLVKGDYRWYELISSSVHQPNAYDLVILDRTLLKNLSSGRCELLTNWTIPQSPFISFQIISTNRTFVKCNSTVHDLGPMESGDINCTGNYKIRANDTYPSVVIPPPGCSIIQLPNKRGGRDNERYVSGVFELQTNASDACSQCYEGEGQCQLDLERKFICAKEATLSVAIGVLIVIGLSFRQKFGSYNVINLLKKESLTHQSVEAFLKNNKPFGIRRYNYSDIKKMTKFFRDKLGQGGYGSVYKGKLQDGSLVAVKVLKGSTGNGEEFINEVASISRTSHVNIVTLRGFCFEGSKRALVYEFMPNGSLEKFIYKKDSPSDHQLQWETLYKIAVGIARGLEYLHRGCNTRILHFDIKPHNILLDENFCPKISDFGLAKVCPREQSIISMLGARGTAGYIAPEVFCRNIGGVSHKSDVYSYGMMVLEMLGGRKNIDAEVDRTSEIFFPHWIYRRLELDEELTLHGLMTEEDRQNAKKMTIVSLWCIQTDPSNRPAMSRVVEMLEMSHNSLQIPPKPFLSSPTRLEADSSTVVVLSHSGS
ncbi:rust resistance kinase Lr10-like isoform X2 [Juglans regia]|uniref:Rust resistance kinase Lr10-like isoform X2 n=1 Tax=Juglans regia TaxID=51240 RepID=A0A6P9E4B0_JUGRE|nr:rust resistance kinase Lr10-like isoform X2 [Juglans regia]